jgi:hypothetical protein
MTHCRRSVRQKYRCLAGKGTCVRQSRAVLLGVTRNCETGVAPDIITVLDVAATRRPVVLTRLANSDNLPKRLILACQRI